MFVDPKNDIAFKKIFGDTRKTEILISFLNAVLELPNPIASLTIASPYQPPKIIDLKETTLDVKAVDTEGREFVVEMQVEGNEYFGKRALYYLAKSYVGQIRKAEDYKQLKPAYFVGILNFNMLDGESYLTRHILINQDSGHQDLQDFEFNFIELKKFSKNVSELDSIVDKWIYFIKNAAELDVIPSVITERPLIEAFDTANQMRWSKAELEVYDFWSGKEGDASAQLETATKVGHQEGMQQGIAQGIQQGKNENAIEIAKKLLDVLDSETIALKTGLSLNEIKALRTP